MLNFAHEGVKHADDVESATHNWPSLAILGLVVIVLMVIAYLLLMSKPEPQEHEEKKQ